jgi:hypothetical protein
MADSKISALPASTTPLAGTEVVPLVQSGATKKVAVSDLTAGRAVSGLSFTGGTMKISGAALETTTANGDYSLTPNGTGRVVIGGNASSFAWSGIPTEIRNGFRVYDSGSSSFGLRMGFSSNVPYFQGYRETVGVTNLILQKDGGDVSIGAGNLVFSTAGKGLSFSNGPKWITGSGSPEGVVTAAIGSLYTRTDGGLLSTLYVKESGAGNTGWVAK